MLSAKKAFSEANSYYCCGIPIYTFNVDKHSIPLLEELDQVFYNDINYIVAHFDVWDTHLKFKTLSMGPEIVVRITIDPQAHAEHFRVIVQDLRNRKAEIFTLTSFKELRPMVARWRSSMNGER